MFELMWFAVTVFFLVKFPEMHWALKALLWFNLLPQTYLLLVKANRMFESRQLEREFMEAATKVEADYVPGQEDMDRVFESIEKQGQSDQQVRARLVHMYGDRVGEHVFQRWLAGGRQMNVEDIEGIGHTKNEGIDG